MKRHERKRLPSSPEEWLMHALNDLNLARLGQEKDDLLNKSLLL
jgi:hypothetical protein